MLLFGSCIVLCCVLLTIVSGSNLSNQHFTAVKEQHWSVEARRSRRGLDIEGSCGQSPVLVNSTLKGGIQSGYFRKLAQYVAMQLCVELCCEEKGCDVAFMTGKNCYGVQCFSEDLCRAVPVKKQAQETILISHVTIQGERAADISGVHPTNLKCLATRMKVGVTLQGGLRAGNFTDVGKIDSMPLCAKLCCVSENCDLALMISNNCFLVSCYSQELCKSVTAKSTAYKPSIAYVTRHKAQAKNDTVSKLNVLHTARNRLLCKNSHLYLNSTFLGGYDAGNFTDLGKVANMSACIRLCCGDKQCDAAFMLERNCYSVDCKNEELCTPVRAKRSSALTELNPKISFITSRSEEVQTKSEVTKDGGLCHAGAITYDVTLRGGIRAGNFTPHGRVENIESCIRHCCEQKTCNVAMVLRHDCFTVECNSEELCEKKPSKISSRFGPRLAYVIRQPMKKAFEWRKSKLNISKITQIPSTIGDEDNITHLTNTQILNAKNITLHPVLNSNYSDTSLAKQIDAIAMNATTLETIYADHTMLNVSGVLDQLQVDESSSRNRTNSSSHTTLIKRLKYIKDDLGCTNSETIYNMTLRGGVRSGVFKDRGKADRFEECVRICCYSRSCDLAFMLGKQCFSVQCLNEEACQAVPAKSHDFSPRISYIYARLKSITKRAITRHDKIQQRVVETSTNYNHRLLLRREMTKNNHPN